MWSVYVFDLILTQPQESGIDSTSPSWLPSPIDQSPVSVFIALCHYSSQVLHPTVHTFLVQSAAGNLIFLLSCASIANYYGGSTHNGEFSCNSFITHQPAIWWRDTSKPRVTDTVKLISPKVAEGRDGTSIGLDQHCASIWSRSSCAGTEEDGFYITLDHLLTPELMLAKKILVHMHYLIRTKSCSSSLLDLIASEKS